MRVCCRSEVVGGKCAVEALIETKYHDKLSFILPSDLELHTMSHDVQTFLYTTSHDVQTFLYTISHDVQTFLYPRPSGFLTVFTTFLLNCDRV
jgi:hypothetical protein